MTKQVDSAQLKAFSPIDSLKKDNLAALVKKTKVRDAQPGEALFREGDAEKRTFYILSGTVELREGNQPAGKITGATEDARNPLSPKLPRRQTAVATTAVEYITIDSDLLDVMLTWDQTGSYAAANQGVPQNSAGQHPSDFHALAAGQLQGRRRRHQAR